MKPVLENYFSTKARDILAPVIHLFYVNSVDIAVLCMIQQHEQDFRV